MIAIIVVYSNKSIRWMLLFEKYVKHFRMFCLSKTIENLGSLKLYKQFYLAEEFSFINLAY